MNQAFPATMRTRFRYRCGTGLEFQSHFYGQALIAPQSRLFYPNLGFWRKDLFLQKFEQTAC
jgi:hypothetical protein